MCLMAVHLTERPPRRKERCLSAGRPDAGERCDDLPLPAPSRQISHANGRAPSARAGHGQLLERVLPWLSGSSSCHGAHVARLLTSILQDVLDHNGARCCARPSCHRMIEMMQICDDIVSNILSSVYRVWSCPMIKPLWCCKFKPNFDCRHSIW
jgi:hypothetical protein